MRLKEVLKKKRFWFFSMVIGYLIFCQSCMTMRKTSKETADFFREAKVEFVSKTLKVGEHNLHIIASGDQSLPALVFIHGSPGSWDAFANYLIDKKLRTTFYLVSIDRPGFGYSDFGNALSMLEQTEIIHNALKQLNLRSIKLVGHSLGGPVVCDLAAWHPDTYRHLVILAGSVDPKAENPERWRSVVKAKPIRYFIPIALRVSNDELYWLKRDLYTLQPKLKNITATVTIVHGTKDRLVPYENVSFLKHALTSAKAINVVSIENADHFIPWSHSEIVTNAILKTD